MITTVLYDMDGLLLDTEPLWGTCMMRVAERHKIPVTPVQLKETTGLRIYEVTEYWSVKYPWEGKGHQEVAEEILDEIISCSRTDASVLRGVVESLKMFRENGFQTALASSSPYRMINELVTHFGIRDYFDAITSADEVRYGKPHPAVFLHCAGVLGSKPSECLVLEDSLNGMIAGKAARMKVIVVPEASCFNDPRFSLADGRLRSLEELTIEMVRAL